MSNWKAVLIGAVAFIVMTAILGFVGGAIGGLIGAILGGLIGSWVAKVKSVVDGIKVGLLSGLIGGFIVWLSVLIIGLGTARFFEFWLNQTTITAFGIFLVGFVLISGPILGLIGGVIGSFLVKKK